MSVIDEVKKIVEKSYHRYEEAVLVNFFMPCEIFYALDIPVLSAEALAILDEEHIGEAIERAEGEGISETMCGYHRSFIGQCLRNPTRIPAYIIHSSLACDGNQLTYRWLSHHAGIPHYSVDVPYQCNEETIDYVATQLKDMAEQLSSMSDRVLDEQKLIQVIDRSRETMRQMNRLVHGGYAVSVQDALAEAYLTNVGLGSEDAYAYVMSRVENRQIDQPRYLWMSTAPTQPMTYFDAQVHGFELRDIDVIEEKDPYRYMALRLLSHPYNGPIEQRINHVVNLANHTKANGIILFTQWGCKLTAGGSVLMKRALEEAGYPTLLLNGDAVDQTNHADGQASTRLSAFMEMVNNI